MTISALTSAAGIAQLLWLLPDIYSAAVDAATDSGADGSEYCMGTS